MQRAEKGIPVPVEKFDLDGNPYIGVFLNANDKVLLIPERLSDNAAESIEKALNVEVLYFYPGTRLLGSLLAMNNAGILFSEYIRDSVSDEFLREVEERGMRVGFLEDKLTALGNNILLNNKKALLHPGYGRRSIKFIEDTLDVETAVGTIAGIKVTGSVGVVTDKGLLVHPKLTSREEEALEEFFCLSPVKVTVNFGSPFVGAAVVANNRGALVGSKSTGIEMGKVEDGLSIL